MVIGMRWQAAGEIDAPAIEEPTIRSDRDEDRRVAVLGDADGCRMPNSRCCHVLPLWLHPRAIVRFAFRSIWQYRTMVVSTTWVLAHLVIAGAG